MWVSEEGWWEVCEVVSMEWCRWVVCRLGLRVWLEKVGGGVVVEGGGGGGGWGG